jgi:8-oxo-dGTP diphosphatase
MKNTTLCYIENKGRYLMLHRTFSKGDGNDGKWIGVGGHFEENESPFDCVIREVREETGLTLLKPKYRGVVTFVSDKYQTEQMHLFTCNKYDGEIIPCTEGELCWVEKSKLFDLPMWEGDRVFLGLLDSENSFFSLKLVYEGDALIDSKIIMNDE